MRKLLFVLNIGIVLLFIGCSSKESIISINSSAVKKLPFVNDAMQEYIKAKKDPKLNEIASKQMYKASKIAKVLAKEDNPQMAEHYAYLLKNQIKIARLTQKKFDTIQELNDIIIKRNQAIEDAKHQDDVDADEEETILPVSDPNSIKDKFKYKNENGIDIFTINGRYFDNDEVVFNKDLKSFISYLVSYLNAHPSKIVILSSFTDGVGSQAYSVDMALRRANRIKEELVDFDIDEDRIKVDAKGAVDFVASNDNEQGRIQNNRIIVKIK